MTNASPGDSGKTAGEPAASGSALAHPDPSRLHQTLPIHHIGIVQPDMASAEHYMDVFGHVEDYRGYVPEFECWCLFLKADAGPAVELVVPTGGSLAKFNRGAGGLHHFAYETPDLVALQAAFAARDMKMLQPEPVKGAGDFLCNFLSPLVTRGVLVEYVQMLR